MDEDLPRKKPSAHEVGMPLDTISLGELQQRIELLEGEIGRLRAAIEARHQTRSAAESFFNL